MKPLSRWTLFVSVAGLAVLLLVAGCTLTPHANVGIGLSYSGGSFHVNPGASVGVYGRP